MGEKFRCVQPTWDELYKIGEEVAEKIRRSGFQPDMIVGIARGGWFHARIMCDFLGVVDLLSLKVAHWGATATVDKKAKLLYPFNFDLSGRKILLIDDITDTGDSFIVAREHLLKLNPEDVKSATLYHIRGAKFVPDYYGREIEWVWVIFPWNFYEDIINLSSRILKHGPLTVEELSSKLKETFNAHVDAPRLASVLQEGKRRGVFSFENGRWRLKT